MTTKKEPILVGEYSLFSILAFVLGFLFWPLGLVFGLIALDEIKKYPQDINKGSKYLAWAGIVIQPLLFLISLMMLKFFFTLPFWI